MFLLSFLYLIFFNPFLTSSFLPHYGNYNNIDISEFHHSTQINFPSEIHRPVSSVMLSSHVALLYNIHCRHCAFQHSNLRRPLQKLDILYLEVFPIPFVEISIDELA